MHKVTDVLPCSQLYQMHVPTNLIPINVINNLIYCGGIATNSAHSVAHFEVPEKPSTSPQGKTTSCPSGTQTLGKQRFYCTEHYSDLHVIHHKSCFLLMLFVFFSYSRAVNSALWWRVDIQVILSTSFST